MSNQSWWISKGFSEFPRVKLATGEEILYRIYGGTSELKGSFYSLKNPASVSQAERDLNIVKWGNTMLFVASFTVRVGTPLFIGRIDQNFGVNSENGEEVYCDANINAEQVYIPYELVDAYLTFRDSRALYQDYFVVIPKNQLSH